MYVYKCDDCIHNKDEDNYFIEYCEKCAKGHCILCTWQQERVCEDYKSKKDSESMVK